MFCDLEMPEPELVAAGAGNVAVISRKSPAKEGHNEDAAMVITIGDGRSVLAVADGMGGCPAADEAARLALQMLASSVRDGIAAGKELRHCIVDGFDAANQAVLALGVGAGTTLAVVTVKDARVRSYHVGDTAVFLVGQRGKNKYLSVPHSPTGYAQEAGLIDEEQALAHDERHLVSNAVGDLDMKIEVGPAIEMAAHDTLLIATDGLWDNLRVEEVSEAIRKGALAAACRTLADRAQVRMANGDTDAPSKPDDLTFAAFRRRS